MYTEWGLSQIEFHVYIGPGVWGGYDAAWRDVLESDRLVKADCGREDAIGFQVEAARTGGAGGSDHGFEQLAADTVSPMVGSHGHLGNLEFVRASGEECAAGDTLAFADCEEDTAARGEDVGLRVVESFLIFGFDAEVAGNPLFV